jgi:heterodisulfide reductase subunit B
MSNHAMQTRPELRARVEEAVGEPYAGDTEVLHLLEILDREYGLDKLKEKIVRPLAGLKVACYYGCLLVRPPKIMQFDDAENPTIMERVIQTTGVEPIKNWSHKLECCGASFAMARTDVVVRCVNDIVKSAEAAGADALVVACPMCQANCDMRQAEANKGVGENHRLPVVYFTQLLGLALGRSPKELGMQRLLISPGALLEKLHVSC